MATVGTSAQRPGAVRAWPVRTCGRGLVRAWLVLIVLLGLATRPQSTAAQVASEYEVKAAFLYNFAKFVAWPAQNFPLVGNPFSLCLLGDDPFGGLLERAVAGKSVQDRAFAVRRLADVEEAGQCQMLFVSSSEHGHVRRILAALTGASVLTVGDTEEIVHSGGMIGFHMEGNRVRFMVNQDTVERAGLQISSQLLKVADKVITSDAVRQ